MNANVKMVKIPIPLLITILVFLAAGCPSTRQQSDGISQVNEPAKTTDLVHTQSPAPEEDKENNYSFSFTDRTGPIQEAIKEMLPNLTASGKVHGVFGLGGPDTSIFVLLAKGKTVFNFLAEEALSSAVPVTENPTRLTLTGTLIRVQPGTSVKIAISDSSKKLSLPGPVKELLVIAEGQFGIVITAEGSELNLVDPYVITKNIPFSAGAQWVGLGTINNFQWITRGDVVRTNLLPLNITRSVNELRFDLLAAETPESTMILR